MDTVSKASMLALCEWIDYRDINRMINRVGEFEKDFLDAHRSEFADLMDAAETLGFQAFLDVYNSLL
ncbi:unnamed protein product [Rodentolepis nana]|nr:unnamed protein product [Rodentolepis nana]VDO11623.1 unnamed protein product [Rodentolepis nana]